MYEHKRTLSLLKVVVSKGRRKCTECKNIINKGDKLLVGYNVDMCPHKKKNSNIIFHCHIKLQFCKSCLPKIKNRYIEIQNWELLMKKWNNICHISKEEYEELIKHSVELRSLQCMINDSPLKEYYPKKDMKLNQKIIIALGKVFQILNKNKNY